MEQVLVKKKKRKVSDEETELSAKILKSIVLALDLKTYELADQISVNQQQFYDYTMAKRLPNWPIWLKIKQTFPQVDGNFLLTGQGSVLLEESGNKKV